jgi:Protein of unknown function (DUF3306)
MAESRGPGGDGGGFLSRWSKRKTEVRHEQQTQERVEPTSTSPGIPPLMPSRPTLSISPATKFAAMGAPPAATDAVAPQELPLVELHSSESPSAVTSDKAKTEAEFLPTLDDVAKLEPGANIAGFVGRNVAPEVRNAAVKKLFADPHFNVMDGLDVYIDDYNKTEPLPRQWLRQMMQARVLGLLDDEVQDQDLPTPDEPPPETPSPHEDTDLPLQPDDAAGRGGSEEGAGDIKPVEG